MLKESKIASAWTESAPLFSFCEANLFRRCKVAEEKNHLIVRSLRPYRVDIQVDRLVS